MTKFLKILCSSLILLSLLNGCVNYNKTTNKDLINDKGKNELIDSLFDKLPDLLSNNIIVFNSVVKMVRPNKNLWISLKNGTISFKENNENFDEKQLEQINNCFTLLNEFYDGNSFIDILNREVFGKEVIEFGIHIEDIEIGLVYSEECLDETYKVIADNWYCFRYGLV